MGMYVELIFGAQLKKDTPKEVIDTLKYMIEDDDDASEPEPISSGKIEGSLFRHYSTSFPVSTPQRTIIYDKIEKCYVVSTRSSFKNYNREIETFLEWIKPYIDFGSGLWGMYAITMYELFAEPTIYYLDNSKPKYDI